jgi:hypothetical protein
MSDIQKWVNIGVFLTKDSDEALAGFGSFHENVQLFGQLFALSTILLRFTSDLGHEVGGHRTDSHGRKDIVKRGYQLDLDDFDCDVVDETFQSNLFK